MQIKMSLYRPMTNSQTQQRGHKIHYTNILGDENSVSKIYKDIRWEKAMLRPSGSELRFKDKGVQTNNQRGRGPGPSLDKSHHIVPAALLVRVQCFRKDLYKAVEGPYTRPIVKSFQYIYICLFLIGRTVLIIQVVAQTVVCCEHARPLDSALECRSLCSLCYNSSTCFLESPYKVSDASNLRHNEIHKMSGQISI